MKQLLIALVVLAACSDEVVESPEVAAKQERCRALEAHIYRISPESAPRFEGLDDAAADKLASTMAAQLPAEDIDLCVAAESDILSCMLLAADVEHIKACVPTDEMLKCMGKYEDEHEKRRHCGYRIRDALH